MTIKKSIKSHLKFFDVVILIEDNDETYFRLTFDKKSNQYLWNKISLIQWLYCFSKEIRENHEWQKLKLRYLELKNNHLSGKKEEIYKKF